MNPYSSGCAPSRGDRTKQWRNASTASRYQTKKTTIFLLLGCLLLASVAPFLVRSVHSAEGTLHTVSTQIKDASGNVVHLRGIQVCWNDRMKVQGSDDTATSPSNAWFSLTDVQRIKDAGANCMEMGGVSLAEVMPNKGVPSTSFFSTWVDVWVNWCTQNQIYIILTLKSPSVGNSGFFPSWFWDTGVNDATIRDFFDTAVSAKDSNRAAVVDLFEFMANRYKDNPRVLFGIFNEPFNGVDTVNLATRQHLASTYSTFMGQVIDGVRSSSQKIVFVDHPFLWDSNGWYLAQPIAKDNMAWELHGYVTSSKPLATWKSRIDDGVGYYVGGFGKPLFVGEYGFDRPTCAKASYPSTWHTILADEVSCLDDTSGICGRNFHAWDYMYGEYDVFEGESDFTSSDSSYIMDAVLGGEDPLPTPSPTPTPTSTPTSTLTATINAYCNTEGAYIIRPITMDGLSTGYSTPHTFTGLTGTHTFTVPSTDAKGHPFKQWSTGSTSTTITVSSAGTYTAYFQASAAPSIEVWTDKATYAKGQTLTAKIQAFNPGPAVAVRAKCWFGLPSGGTYMLQTFYTGTIPVSYTSPAYIWKSLTIPTSAAVGTYSVIAEMRNPTTNALIAKDTCYFTIT